MLTDQVAIITGGVRGIGKAIALEMVRQGAKVVLCYRGNDTAANETLREIEELGGNALLLKGDVRSSEFAKEAVKEAVEQYGKVDILVNNAGITRDKLLLRMTEDDFKEVVDTNLVGSFQFLKACAEIMMKKRYGRIINLSSIVGVIGNPGQINYSASKAGILGLTKSAAKELGKRGITVNAVAPGFIETEMTEILSEDQKSQFLEKIPVGRVGLPQEVAHLVAFLSSKEAGYISGQVIGIDGGM
ncbi:MAG: 3-oxoacyl-[acyl-carrier-protein] reductase [Clostridia bacterium]|jgi:3-oxoacyl-[acyl-carrier protein] reductase|nr:3-oxoacyl-[acyl-carrier-protein] reductase [Clostridia bacterium]HPD90135.1 3-oxoacyl-[acyl-carrier-protein] reductase [Bacillota bacterium]